jgi:hypothetical protein
VIECYGFAQPVLARQPSGAAPTPQRSSTSPTLLSSLESLPETELLRLSAFPDLLRSRTSSVS